MLTYERGQFVIQIVVIVRVIRWHKLLFFWLGQDWHERLNPQILIGFLVERSDRVWYKARAPHGEVGHRLRPALQSPSTCLFLCSVLQTLLQWVLLSFYIIRYDVARLKFILLYFFKFLISLLFAHFHHGKGLPDQLIWLWWVEVFRSKLWHRLGLD